MKMLIIMIIAGIVLSQSGISAASSSEDSAAGDLAAAKSFAFGRVGVAGLMSEGERNLRAVLERPDASQQLQAALAQATPVGSLYILVGLRRCDAPPIKRSLIHWLVLMMTLKWCADA